MKTPPFSKY